MGKTTNTSDVLKNILKDVSNVQNIIDDSKKLEKDYSTVDFDNGQEVEKIIEATKLIVDNLKTEVIKIYEYFDTNYKTWNTKVTSSDVDVDAQPNNNNECDTGEHNNEGDHVENVIENQENQCNNESSTVVEDAIVNTEDNCNKESSTIECVGNNLQCSDEISGAKKHSESMSEENTASEPKLFLKCVDINKLINPDILPHLTSPKPLQTNNCDDTVLIISDSEDEVHHKGIKKNKAQNSKNKSSKKGIEKRNVIKDKRSNDGVNRKTKVYKQTMYSDSDTASTSTKRSSLRRRATKQNKYKDLSSSESKSLSDSGSNSDEPQESRVKRTRSHVNKKNIIDVNITQDKKLFYKAYVPLPRIQCEKLKQYYLDQNEIDQVNRLTDLSSLKKRHRKNCDGSSSSASSDKIQSNPKRKRKSSVTSSISDMDVPNDDNELTNVVDCENHGCDDTQTNGKDSENAATGDVLNSILNRLSSDSDKEEKTADDEEKENDSKKDEGKSNKDKDSSESEHENANTNGNQSDSSNVSEKGGNTTDKHSDEHKSEDSEDDKREKKNKNNNWRKDKLLTSKLTDTDSEDELEKFKRESEKAKSDAKARYV